MEFGILAVGFTSFALGGVMTLLAWNVIRQNHRRDAARTALLSQLAFPGGLPRELVTAAPADAVDLFRARDVRHEGLVRTEPLFSQPASLGADSRRTLALGALSMGIAFAIGALVGLASL